MGGSNVVGRRLSKPRTNNSTTSLQLSWSDAPADVPSSPITSSDMDYFGDQVTTVSSQGERRSRRKSRNKLRAYLYGSSSHESSQSLSSDEDDERRNSLVDAARGARKRLSRTGSSIMQLSTAKGSTSYLSSSSTPNLLPSDPEEATHIAEQIKERARLDRIAVQNHISSPIDEDKHVDSVMAPLRRKSLYTPGIATRQASDILRKPPPPQSIQSQADRDYYYNPAYPSTSPLAQLAAMHNNTNGRETPTQDVTHLGGLQLGSLRVTNGAASPAPPSTSSSRHHQRNTSDLNSPEVFQTASEGSDTDEGLTLKPAHLQRLATKSSSSTVELFAPTNQAIANLKEYEQEPYSKRTSFPFQSEPSDNASKMANEYAAECGDFSIANAEPSLQDESMPSYERPFSYSETPSSLQTGVPNYHNDNVGMAMSPSEETQVHLWTSMKDQMETIDDTSGTREDAFSKLNGSSTNSRHSHPGLAANDIDSAYSSRASIPFDQHPSSVVPKTDSGYSSRASLGTGQYRMSTGDASHELKLHRSSLQPRLVSGLREVPPVRSKDEMHHGINDGPPQVRPSFTVIPQHALVKAEPSVTSTGALHLINSARASARAPSQVLVKKLRKARPKSQPPPPVDKITVQGYRDLEQVHIPRVPSLIAAKHAERLVQFPLLDHTFPSSNHVNVSRRSSLTRPYGPSIRFPSPANALESAASGSISAFSHAEPLDADIPGNQNDIGERSDEWTPSQVVKASTWSAFGGSQQKKLQKKAVKERKQAEKRQAREEKEFEKQLFKEKKELEQQRKRSESKERSGRSRRTSWYRGKSSERRSTERDTDAIISDFGTVAESLGGSPYDIARPTHLPNHALQRASWQPHHLSRSVPRPRSMAAVDASIPAETSGAFGRGRSQSIGRPMTPANEFYEADGDVRGRNMHPRPRTMYADVPPVPALPAVDIRQHDWQWAQRRQRSQSVSRAQSTPQQWSASDFREGFSEMPPPPQSISTEAPPLLNLPSSSRIERMESATPISRPRSLVVDCSNSPVSPISPLQEVAADSPAEMGQSAQEEPRVMRSMQESVHSTPSRPQSTIIDSSPPIVSHPRSPRNDFLDEASGSPHRLNRSSEYDTGAPLRKARTSQMAVPDLWTSGSLEKKSPKQTRALEQPDDLNSSAVLDELQTASTPEWEHQRKAWSERRKSAGEALLSQSQLRDTSNLEAPNNAAAPMGETRPEATMTRPTAFIPSHLTTPARRPVSSPLAAYTANDAFPHPSEFPVASQSGSEPHEDPKALFPTPAERRRDQSRSTPIPRKRIGSGMSAPRGTSQNRSSFVASSPNRPVSAAIDADVPTTSIPLMQRYGGGLLYGYEPGQGLGGSAGTRGAQTLASRKSVELSKGFGIDLSDVPVFIVPATH